MSVNAAEPSHSCNVDGFEVTLAQLTTIMGGSCSYCAQHQPYINTALQEAGMACPKRAAAFLAQVRHETAGLSMMYQPIDNGAGALHMLPPNFRKACEAIPTLQAHLGAMFPSCTDPICTCGTDAEAGMAVREPQFAFLTGTWWFIQGASETLGAPCEDLRLDADIGIGDGPLLVTRQNPGAGFYKISACIFGFAFDNGRDQRISFYDLAIATLDNEGPSLTWQATAAQRSLPLQLTAVWNERAVGFGAGDITVSPEGQVAGVAEVASSYGHRFLVNVTGVQPGASATLQLAAGATVADYAGNAADTGSAVSVTVVYDVTPPSATLSTTQSVTASPLQYTATFNEPAVMAANAVSLGLGAGGNVTVQPSPPPSAGAEVYTITVLPAQQGSQRITLTADATDVAGNGLPGEVASQEVVYDTTQPAITALVLQSEGGNATSGGSSPVTSLHGRLAITFSEQVRLYEGAMAVTPAGSISLDGEVGHLAEVWWATISGLQQGAFEVAVGNASDAAGNYLAAGASVQGLYDTVGPAATSAMTVADAAQVQGVLVTKQRTVAARISFSENATVAAADVGVVYAGSIAEAATASCAAGAGAGAGVAQGVTDVTTSCAGAACDVRVRWAGGDGLVMVCVRAAADAYGTHAGPPPGAPGLLWQAAVVVDTRLPLLASLASQVNVATAAANHSLPVVNSSTLALAAAFSEPVQLCAAGITSPGAASTPSCPAVAQQHAFTVSDVPDGVAAVCCANFTDAAGNSGSALAQCARIVVDTAAPNITSLVSPQASGSGAPSTSSTVQVTASFTERVCVDQGTLQLSSGEVQLGPQQTATRCGHSLAWEVAGVADGVFTLRVPHAVDAAGHDLVADAADAISLSVDTTPPTASLSLLLPLHCAGGGACNATTVTVRVELDEAGSIPASGVSTSSGSVQGFNQTSPTTAVFTVAGADDGELEVAAGNFSDSAGHVGRQPAQLSLQLDLTPPRLLSSSLASPFVGAVGVAQGLLGSHPAAPAAQVVPVNTSLHLVFSEQVTVAGLVAANASSSSPSSPSSSLAVSPPLASVLGGGAAASSSQWVADVASSATHLTATLALAASQVRDLAGNQMLAGMNLSFIVDGVPPNLTAASSPLGPIPLSGAQAGAVAGADELAISASFSEWLLITAITPSSGSVASVAVVNSEAEAEAGAGAGSGGAADAYPFPPCTYSWRLTGLQEGHLTLTIAGLDFAGNPLQLRHPLHVGIVDVTAPAATLTTSTPLTWSGQAMTTSSEVILLQVAFSEAVTGFNASGITASSGTVSAFTQLDDLTFTCSVLGVAQGSMHISVAAGVAHDAAGKPNTASSALTFIVDSRAPAITSATQLGSPRSHFAPGDTLQLRLDFDEPAVLLLGSSTTSLFVLAGRGHLELLPSGPALAASLLVNYTFSAADPAGVVHFHFSLIDGSHNQAQVGSLPGLGLVTFACSACPAGTQLLAECAGVADTQCGLPAASVVPARGAAPLRVKLYASPAAAVSHLVMSFKRAEQVHCGMAAQSATTWRVQGSEGLVEVEYSALAALNGIAEQAATVLTCAAARGSHLTAPGSTLARITVTPQGSDAGVAAVDASLLVAGLQLAPANVSHGDGSVTRTAPTLAVSLAGKLQAAFAEDVAVPAARVTVSITEVGDGGGEASRRLLSRAMHPGLPRGQLRRGLVGLTASHFVTFKAAAEPLRAEVLPALSDEEVAAEIARLRAAMEQLGMGAGHSEPLPSSRTMGQLTAQAMTVTGSVVIVHQRQEGGPLSGSSAGQEDAAGGLQLEVLGVPLYLLGGGLAAVVVVGMLACLCCYARKHHPTALDKPGSGSGFARVNTHSAGSEAAVTLPLAPSVNSWVRNGSTREMTRSSWASGKPSLDLDDGRVDLRLSDTDSDEDDDSSFGTASLEDMGLLDTSDSDL